MTAPTLRRQLSRASLVTTLFALLLSAASLLLYELLTYRSDWVDDLRAQADLIAHASSPALLFNDPRAAQENLTLLKQQPRMLAAAVFDADGAPFARYESVGETAPPRADPALQGRPRFAGARVELAYPIVHDGERIGTVYLRAAHDIWTKAAGYALILAGVSGASLLLALLVFGRLQRAITQPLHAVTRVAQEVMAQRDWALRAPVPPTRDIAVLVQAFNGMLAEVAARTGELEREMAERHNAEAGLRLADRRKDEFLATLAHELRNPLAPIMNAAALLRMPKADAAAREMAHGILERQLRQMVRLIDDLLDVSRVATGKLSLHSEPLELVGLVRAAVELAEPQAKAKRLALTAHLPQQPCHTRGDAARLSQVFSNLLNNACRYTPAGGRIDVEMVVRRALPPGDTVEIVVRDTGIGVEPAMHQQVFELFEQADKRLERGNAGLGIGLTLARQLVQLHGGEITLESAGLGHGSSFRVSLPLAADSAPAEPAPAAPEPPPDGASLRVLVADDNVDFTTSLRSWLETQGHEVRVVHDGEAALQAAGSAPPDLVILDIGMPLLNGYEVARRLRADPRTAALKLVAATGWGQRADKEAAAQAGFDHHLVKPVTPDKLLPILAECAPAA